MQISQTWTFEDESVAGHFNQHVRSQLPWYDLVLAGIKIIAAHYLPSEGAVMYDIGASTGNLYLRMKEIIASRGVHYRGIEKSASMAAKWQGEESGLIIADALDQHYEPYDVAVLNLTLMFMPPGERGGWFRRLRATGKPGSAIIVVDRLVEPIIETLIIERLRLQQKVDAGESYNAILEKEFSLIGAQRPIDPAMLEPATMWFKLGGFAGWICSGPPE